MTNSITFGEWLKKSRKRLDFTQESLAELIGCSRDTIRKIEMGIRRPSRQMAELLADALKVSPEAREALIELARTGEGMRPDLLLEPAAAPDNADGAGSTDAAVAGASERRHLLPAPAGPLIGREAALAELRSLMNQEGARLVTLSGPPGIGKTRLALEIVLHMRDDFPNGIYFVPLAALTDAAQVLPSIAHVLDFRLAQGDSLLDSLLHYLHDKSALLVLDNFEHVMQAAQLVSELISASPRLRVLVTSREKLRLSAEHDFHVSSLIAPEPRNLPPAEQLMDYSAVALFVQRARASRRDFALSAENAPAIVEICHRLEGLPLAIELAAARTPILPPQAFVSRLTARLPLLIGGARDLPLRHRTLRSAIDWSYDLLQPSEQRLYRRLSVFKGGCDLQAVEAVCNFDNSLRFDTLELLASLVDKSLLQQGEMVAEPRFYMLETIREHAESQLRAGGEAEALRRAHALYFMALAEEAEPNLLGRGEAAWRNVLETNYDNLRAGLTWAKDESRNLIWPSASDNNRGPMGDATYEVSAQSLGLRLAAALTDLWLRRGYLAEGREWIEALLVGSEPGQPSRERARALFQAGRLAHRLGDLEAARRHFESSLTISRALQDKRAVADALSGLGGLAATLGDYASVQEYLEESLTLSRQAEYKHGAARALFSLASLASRQGSLVAEKARYEESLSLYREIGHMEHMSKCLLNLGNVSIMQGDYATARSFYDESLALARDLGASYVAAIALGNLGEVALAGHDYQSARDYLEESVSLLKEMGARLIVADTLGSLGMVCVALDQLVEARAYLGESLDIARTIGSDYLIARGLSNMGHLENRSGKYAEAASLFSESLALYQTLRNKFGSIRCLVGLAGVATQEGNAEQAALFFGAIDACLAALDARLEPRDLIEYERNQQAAHTKLGDGLWERTYAQGRMMTLDEALSLAKASPLAAKV